MKRTTESADLQCQTSRLPVVTESVTSWYFLAKNQQINKPECRKRPAHIQPLDVQQTRTKANAKSFSFFNATGATREPRSQILPKTKSKLKQTQI